MGKKSKPPQLNKKAAEQTSPAAKIPAIWQRVKSQYKDFVKFLNSGSPISKAVLLLLGTLAVALLTAVSSAVWIGITGYLNNRAAHIRAVATETDAIVSEIKIRCGESKQDLYIGSPSPFAAKQVLDGVGMEAGADPDVHSRSLTTLLEQLYGLTHDKELHVDDLTKLAESGSTEDLKDLIENLEQACHRIAAAKDK